MVRPGRPMRRFAACLVTCLALAGGAPAQTIVSEGGSYARITLLPGTAGSDGARLAGVRITLAEGWKTYWRSPGAAGIPPAFDWSGSGNISAHRVLWPRPEIFESFGLETVGYAGEVVLPIRITPADPTRAMRLALAVSIGLCREICITETARLDARLDTGATGGAEAVARAAARVPPPGPAAGLVALDCRITRDGRRHRLAASLTFEMPLAAPRVLLEGPEGVWFKDIETVPRGRIIEVSADLMAPERPWIDRSAIRLTVLGADGFAADIRGCG